LSSPSPPAKQCRHEPQAKHFLVVASVFKCVTKDRSGDLTHPFPMCSPPCASHSGLPFAPGWQE
jgi:hypothetical protein